MNREWMQGLQKVRDYIREWEMIPPDCHVAAGVSGGADSVCLLRILAELRGEMHFTLTAVHVHHGIRGEEADLDRMFVEALCGTLGVPVRCFALDIPGLAAKAHLSLEEAGRRYRYQCFEQVLAEEAADTAQIGRIAVAHHMDDQAETVLMHLLRGSGLQGLTGIRPVRDNVIHPLLCLSREEILALLNALGQDYRTDVTNASLDYTRNRVRHELLPLAASAVNAQAARHLCAMAETARQLLEDEQMRLAQCMPAVSPQPDRLYLPALLKETPRMRQVLVREALGRRIGLKDLTREHVLSVCRLAADPAGSGKRVDLPGGLQAVRSGQEIRLKKGEDPAVRRSEVCPAGEEFLLSGPSGSVCVDGMTVSWRLMDREEFPGIVQNKYTKWLDYDKMTYTPSLRRRRGGDYLQIDEAGQCKKLRRLFIDEKIPIDCRDAAWLIADGSHVIWLIGGRISAHYKIRETTDRILEIKTEGAFIHDESYNQGHDQ